MTLRTFLLFLYGSGARGYEAFDLRVSDVDLANRLVSLRQPGGNHKRIIPIGRTLRNTLDLYLQLTAAKRVNSDLVFFPDEGRPLKPSSIRSALSASARERAFVRGEPSTARPRVCTTFGTLLRCMLRDMDSGRQRLAAKTAHFVRIHGACRLPINRDLFALGSRSFCEAAIYTHFIKDRISIAPRRPA